MRVCRIALVVSMCVGGGSAAQEKLCRIGDYGASTTSKDNSGAIHRAVAACSTGGSVVVEGGSFNVGPLSIGGSGVRLDIQSGAELVGAFGPDGWPHNGSSTPAMITFTDCAGCALTGNGTIWGKGGRPAGGGFDWYYLFDQGKIKMNRPYAVVVKGGTDFVMSGVTILDSPMFNVALDGVHGAEISYVNITSRWYLDPKTNELKEPHNTDGIDPGGGSRDIHIHHVFIHNGDDSVAVKPSSTCTANILVEHSVFEMGHGCSIGSVGKGCVENVTFRNITMTSQENGCRVKSYSESPGHVKNITWSDIRMFNTSSCITVDANYHKPPKDAKNWINVSELSFVNVVGTNCKNPPSFVCPAQSPCVAILLDNVDVAVNGHSSKNAMQCEHATGAARNTVEPASCLGK
jgi:polygalacturonase